MLHDVWKHACTSFWVMFSLPTAPNCNNDATAFLHKKSLLSPLLTNNPSAFSHRAHAT